MPLEIRFKVMRKVSELSKKDELDLILVKLWKIVKMLGNSQQIGYFTDGDDQPDRADQDERLSSEAKYALTQMIVMDLALYHSFLALIALSIASISPLISATLDLHQAYLSFLKP